jgi:hypothetical protein
MSLLHPLLLLTVTLTLTQVQASCPMIYKQSPNPPTSLFTSNVHSLTSSLTITLQSLSGTIAKSSSPIIYFTSEDSQYDEWLSDIEEKTDIIVNNSFINDPNGLIDFLLSSYSGDIITSLVSYTDKEEEGEDVSEGVANAVTYCAGTHGSIAAAASVVDSYSMKYNLPIVFNATSNDSEELPKTLIFSDNSIVFQQPSAQPFLVDYAVFSGSPYLTWSDSLRDDHLNRLSAVSSTCAAAYGWVSDEGSYVSHLAEYGVFVHASDWAQNMVPLSNIKVSIPALPTRNTELNDKKSDSLVHTATFVMTDGDNFQWLLGTFLQDSWYGSPDMPTTNMGFTLSPAMSQISSVTMSHIYAQATECTSIIASPSGLGYIYPELLTSDDLNTFSSETSDYMSDTQMKILNILAGNDDISDYRMQQSSSSFLVHENIEAVLYYTYGSGYAGGRGKAMKDEVTGKPIITARFSLWDDGSYPDSSPMLGNEGMITALMDQLKDPTSVDGYSVIAVHAWTHTTSDVAYITEQIKAMDPQIDIVTPDEFLRRFNENVKF